MTGGKMIFSSLHDDRCASRKGYPCNCASAAFKRKPTITTKRDPKPIPDRRYDWEAIQGEWDLGDPIGYGPTEAEAIEDLKLQFEDKE